MIKPKWSFLSRRKDDKRYIISMVSHGAVQVEFTLRRLPWWLDLESPLEKALLFECVFVIKCPYSAKRPLVILGNVSTEVHIPLITQKTNGNATLQEQWSSFEFFTLTEHSQYIFVTVTVSVIASFNKSNIKVLFWDKSVVSQRRNKRPVLIKRPVSK